MSIGTYAELKTAAANWLVRGDLTARIPEFIILAESRINRVLRARRAEVDQTLTGVIGSRCIPLPSAYGEALGFWIVQGGGRVPLLYADPANINAATQRSVPQIWTVDGSNIAFDCPCDQAYSFVLRMLSKFQLSDAAPTNALLSDYPDVYLFATLVEASPFLRDADLASAYEARLLRAINEVNEQDARATSNAILTTEISLMSGRRYGFDINRGE